MSEIHYVRQHRLPLGEAKKMVQKAADELAAEYDLTSQWEGDTLHFRRSGVDGRMAVSAEQVELQVKLGFLLRPFKAKFEEHIERNLDRALASATAVAAAKKPTAGGPSKAGGTAKVAKASDAGKAGKGAAGAAARPGRGKG